MSHSVRLNSAFVLGGLLLASCSSLGKSEESGKVLVDHGGGYVRMADYFEGSPALRLGTVEIAPDIEGALIRQANDEDLPKEEVQRVLAQLKKEIGDGLLDLAANKAIGATVMEASYDGQDSEEEAADENTVELECSLITLELAGNKSAGSVNLDWVLGDASKNARFKAVVKLRVRKGGRLLVAQAGEGLFQVEQERTSTVEKLEGGKEKVTDESSETLTLNGPVKRAVEIAVQTAWGASWSELKKRMEFEEAEATTSNE